MCPNLTVSVLPSCGSLPPSGSPCGSFCGTHYPHVRTTRTLSCAAALCIHSQIQNLLCGINKLIPQIHLLTKLTTHLSLNFISYSLSLLKTAVSLMIAVTVTGEMEIPYYQMIKITLTTQTVHGMRDKPADRNFIFLIIIKYDITNLCLDICVL